MNNMPRSALWKALLLLVMIVPLLTGCWDRLEIEERAVILGIAVDLADPAEKKEFSEVSHIDHIFPKPNTSTLIKVTAQIAVPGRIPLGPGDSGGGGSSKGQKPVWVLSAVGSTVDDAMMVLQQELADRIFLGHLRVIVISEEYARRGLSNLNDFFRRNPEVRRLAWLVVSKEKASKLIDASPELERVPALYLLAMMDHAVEMGKYPNEFVGKFWSKLSSKGQEPYLPYVSIKTKENIDIAGLAYFKGDKMVGKTKPLEIGFFMGITGFKGGGYTAFIPFPNASNNVMFRATYRTAKTRVSILNGKPHAEVWVQIEGNIEEKSDEHMPSFDHKEVLALEQEIAKRTEEGYIRLIKQTQEVGTDIFGFGEYIRARLPDYWNREIKTKQNWQKKYKELTVKTHVQIKIRRIGMTAK